MRYVREIKYGLHVIFHPFDGFWDLKKERRGSLAAALTFVAIVIMLSTFEKQTTGFLFNTVRLKDVNVVVDILTVTMVYVLWCVANWCLTSLMDGEGTMKDIFTAMGYALVPMILVRIPMIILSLGITIEEGTFYYVLNAFSYIWTGILVFFGTMITHQYSFKKTVLTCICTVVGMGIIMFIGLLFFNVIQQMITFFTTIYKEIRF
ncbi:MAG: YIP1 family protein [Lachnospiraceae bacterium]|nr:YIP1 family protein [Lachnospiraceae bacterium]